MSLFQSVSGLFHFGGDVQLDAGFPNSDVAPDSVVDQEVSQVHLSVVFHIEHVLSGVKHRSNELKISTFFMDEKCQNKS